MSPSHPNLPSQFAALEQRSYKTYKARLHASRRLAARNRAWNASLIATSTAATIASVALLTDASMYGRSGPTILVCSSILTLVASLVTSGLDYSGRFRDMKLNYRRVQRLSAEAERRVHAPEHQSAELLDELHRRYDALLDESENHTETDFHRAQETDVGRRLTWREDLISALPYVSLLAPVGLLVPFVLWIIHG